MAILLTGGKGKTSSRLGRILKDAKIPFIMTSRRGDSGFSDDLPVAKFDLTDESTYKGPFQHSSLKGEKISAIYLVLPETADPVTPSIAFINYAVGKHGVKRFVLLSGTTATKGGPMVGKIWEHLARMDVEYSVLKASWIMENFSEWQYPGTIKNQDKIYTACKDGRIPFISAEDIAAVAFHALTDAEVPGEAVRVLGPELLTYDEAAAKFSQALGREIVHVRLNEEQNIQQYKSLGLDEATARFMTWLEVNTSGGKEAMTNDIVESITGRPPKTLDVYIQETKAAWQ
ncbi:related to nucleoside-diphosphate-sugar epimerase family protein [Rhynchosporium agropyri]|uniref:Related to nucleoside-diphosphate-sugar epimerase family protein n=1 Tax=Rhynchosporium agropyri TaxID=914238 RepID=A0A1E1LQJ8_9HELO|nr:related to nucleoside-diphosphate-sugar epimerase family protein [Rhynchosporium agropyri]